MYQPKVKQVEEYSDNQGEHLVHRGKLILLPESEEDEDSRYVESSKTKHWAYLRPIIISETEEIEVGDKVISQQPTYIKTVSKIIDNGAHTNKHVEFENDQFTGNLFSYNKILALPEHFSESHLEAIVDGKMEDGDEVLIKCERGQIFEDVWEQIYLDQENHITLFPVKQSLEEGYKQWNVNKSYNHPDDYLKHKKEAFKAGAKWAKNNKH